MGAGSPLPRLVGNSCWCERMGRICTHLHTCTYTRAHARADRDTLIHIDTEQHHEMIPDEERQQQRLRSFCSHHPTPHPSFTPSMYNTNACTHAYPHAAHSAHNWGLYVSLAWLPTFFSASYDMDLSESALYSVLPYVSGALASAGAG